MLEYGFWYRNYLFNVCGRVSCFQIGFQYQTIVVEFSDTNEKVWIHLIKDISLLLSSLLLAGVASICCSSMHILLVYNASATLACRFFWGTPSEYTCEEQQMSATPASSSYITATKRRFSMGCEITSCKFGRMKLTLRVNLFMNEICSILKIKLSITFIEDWETDR